MTRTAYFGAGSSLALALTLGVNAPALAQNAPSQPAEVQEVVVTGSLIRGTPEDAALPVDVIGQEELEKQGTPSTVELLKALPVSNGVLGDTNQFDARAQGSEGSGSVNLRGLGPERTLVLLNGHRMAINPFALAGAGAVDTNTIPVAAIGRVEVLKDGAAATYGSDAVAGVVNFITRKGFNGVEVGANYRWIDGSDGEYGAHVNIGKAWDIVDGFVSFSYNHRSELPARERSWAMQPYQSNPEGGWSAAGDPASYVPLGSLGTRFRDTQCATLGGFPGFSGVTPTCQWHYTMFDNLVEEENRYQAYGELNIHITDKTNGHVDLLWSSTDVPHWRTSPSYALLSTPTASVGGVFGNYFVPANNPGLVAFRTANPTIPATWAVDVPAFGIHAGDDATISSATLAGGALLIASRPYGLGGNPMFGYGASEGRRSFDTFRVSTTLDGTFGSDIDWNLGLTYGEERGVRTGYDTVVNRYQLALRGYGSRQSDIQAGNGGCTAAETNNWTSGAGNAALGCYFFNPFSSAIPQNVFTGQTTPQHTTALENDVDLTRWFFVQQRIDAVASLFTIEATLSGKFAWNLPGGQPAWALGAQHRTDRYRTRLNEWYNREVNPCVDTPTSGNMSCANPNGPLAFLGMATPSHVTRDVNAAYGELSIPITDALQVQAAARYENYGGQTGDTFNPKLSVRWQMTPMFALRGSIGSTFRAPALTQIDESFVTSLQNIAGTFRAVDIYGNPALEPETAKTYSVGFIADVGGLKATIDYWNFDFDKPIVAEPVGGIVNTIFPNGAGAGDCTTYPDLAARFVLTGGTCNTSAIQRLKTKYINGPKIQTSGVDALAEYRFGDLGFAELTIGGSVTYVREYKVGKTLVESVPVANAFDAVGYLNYQTTAYPLPQWKGEAHVELTHGDHTLRWTTHYIDSYIDQRTAPFAANAYHGPDSYSDTFTVTAGKKIDSTIISDLTYRGLLPMDTTLVISVDNIFDEDPSFARLDLNYDPFTGDPIGRNFKVSVTKRF